MIEIRLDPPRRVNPEGLVEALGHPFVVDLRPGDGLAVAVRVQDRYEDGEGREIVPGMDEAALLAAVAAHDPDRKTARQEQAEAGARAWEAAKDKRRRGEPPSEAERAMVLDRALGIP